MGRTINAPQACDVLIPERCPAYITWERCAALQQRLANNRTIAESLGAPREGPSLLVGLLVCGRCGRRWLAADRGKANRLRYTCRRATIDSGVPDCLSRAGAFLDDFVAEHLLPVLPPASLAVSLAAEDALRAERVQLETPGQPRLERAPYNAERAARQYSAVEPENRWVARALERQWEETLRHEQREQEAYARFRRERPGELTVPARAAIRPLAQDMPGVWAAAETTAQDRKELVRVWLDQITVDVQGDSEQVDVTLRWAGGGESPQGVIRPVARYDQLLTYPQLLARIDTWRNEGLSFEQIAVHLTRAGFYPPKRTDRFHAAMVAGLLSRRGLHGPRPRALVAGGILKPHEYWLTDLARELTLPIATLPKWQRSGWRHSRKVAVAAGRWAIWADEEELGRLRRLRA